MRAVRAALTVRIAQRISLALTRGMQEAGAAKARGVRQKRAAIDSREA
jgi:hypothetical protein